MIATHPIYDAAGRPHPAKHNLPVHPAYAMLMGGRLDRIRMRVAWLGLKHGRRFGRHEWEMRYYRDEMETLGCEVDLG